MLVFDLKPIAHSLQPGAKHFAKARTSFTRAGAGEGDFRFTGLTLGLVLFDLPSHATAHGDGARRRLPLRAGQGWVLPAGIEGWCAWQEETAFLNVEIEQGLLGEAGLTDPGAIRPVVGDLDPLVVQLALALHGAAETETQLYRDGLSAALAGRLSAMSFTRDEPTRAAGIDPRLRRALDALQARFTEDLGLEELAGIAAISPFHFARRFKEATGKSPHRYLVKLRIERAKLLLKTTALPVSEIAFRVGWDNPSHFTAAFRQQTGGTPGAFRAG